MLRNLLYYHIKPFVPRTLRMDVRRWFVKRKLERVRNIWPILPGSECKPEGWPGWPDAKQFAFVLSHDVESQRGLDRVKQLAELEMSLDFRSSFNFIPEGPYSVSPALRSWLLDRGFEVGVHDLHHDGKLYSSREEFRRKAERINRYVKEWNADGFRSGFMLNRLDWIRDLDVTYDASTFDTDPFEPQPDGVGTIFPFWVPAPEAPGGRRETADGRRLATEPTSDLRPPTSAPFPSPVPCPPSPDDSPSSPVSRPLSPDTYPRSGYVELPYTLPQDSTLFLLMREKSSDIWQRKLDWIARHGGLALVNVHPDYIHFGGAPFGKREFSVEVYKRFLKWVKTSHEGTFWHALPRETAAFARSHRDKLQVRMTVHNSRCCRNILPPRRKIWIDLENTPHIPFFKPIIRELENRGYTVLLTARDAFQTCEMATDAGFPFRKIGRHYGRSRVMKVLGLLTRGFQLLSFAWREKPHLGLNHGSRAQILACNLLRIPTILIMDYEHTKTPPFVRPWWEIVPEVVSQNGLHCRHINRIRKFAGIKEDVYVPDFKPNPAILEQLGLNGDIIVTVRPPATEAHYHNPEAEQLFARFIDRICATPGVQAVMLPRNKAQHQKIVLECPHWFKDSKVIIPPTVVDGLNLLWHSDLAVSGGGTMNREAAALGVPVYSIFRGKIGAVDRSLQAEGRLMLVENSEAVDAILLERRTRNGGPDPKRRQALDEIMGHVEAILVHHYPPDSYGRKVGNS